MLLIAFLICVLTGCGKGQEVVDDYQKNNQDNNGSEASMDNDKISEEVGKSSLDISSIQLEYYPIDVSLNDNVIIAKQAENIAKYGLIDIKGEVIVSPQYKSMSFLEMDNQKYILVEDNELYGVLNVDGTELLSTEYKEILIAGNSGWLATKDGQQFLLDKEGNVEKTLSRKYDELVGEQYLYFKPKYVINEGIYTGFLCDMEENIIMENIDIVNSGSALYVSENGKTIIKTVNTYKSDGTSPRGTYIVYDNGNEVAKIGPGSILDVDYEKKEITIAIWDNDGYDTSSKELEEGDYVFHIDTKEFTPATSDEPYIEQTGNFYRLFDSSGNDVFGERFVEIEEWDDQLYLLTNEENQCAVGDVDCQIIVPFGDIKSGNDDYFHVMDKKVEDSSDTIRVDEEFLYLFAETEQGMYEIIVYQK